MDAYSTHGPIFRPELGRSSLDVLCVRTVGVTGGALGASVSGRLAFPFFFPSFSQRCPRPAWLSAPMSSGSRPVCSFLPWLALRLRAGLSSVWFGSMPRLGRPHPTPATPAAPAGTRGRSSCFTGTLHTLQTFSVMPATPAVAHLLEPFTLCVQRPRPHSLRWPFPVLFPGQTYPSGPSSKRRS